MTTPQISVWEQLCGHQHSVEWTKPPLSMQQIFTKCPYVGIENLEYIVTRARPRHIEAPKRLVIHLTKMCFKKDI